MEYFAFGETFVEEHRSSNNSPYKFNGKELDEETGWYYYGARYYDPRVSVWLSVDPMAEQTLDVYSYCLQNPVNYIDPNGLFKTRFGAWLHKTLNGGGGDILKNSYGQYHYMKTEGEGNDYTIFDVYGKNGVYGVLKEGENPKGGWMAYVNQRGRTNHSFVYDMETGDYWEASHPYHNDGAKQWTESGAANYIGNMFYDLDLRVSEVRKRNGSCSKDVDL